MRNVKRRANSGHDRTSDETRSIVGYVCRDGDRLLVLNDTVFTKSSYKQELSKTLAVSQVRLTLAIEGKGVRAFGEVLLTKYREASIAIKAMPTIGIQRQNN
jgi:hypothetical protein